MAVRVNIIHQTHTRSVAHDLRRTLLNLSDNASDNMEQDLFLSPLDTWAQTPQHDPTELRRIIQDQEQKAHKALLSSGRKEKGQTKGLRGLFRSLRPRDIPRQPFQKKTAK